MEVETTTVRPGKLTAARASVPGPGRPPSLQRPPKVLLVATLFKMPYQVVRCISETGASVFVLGSSGARGLRHSRYCRRFFGSTSRIDGGLNAELILEINRVVNALSIDLIVAGDAPSTRSLVEISRALDAPCFPMPDLGAFDILNNKWRFTQLCRELGVTCPDSRLFSSAHDLLAEHARGGLRFPMIAKPLSMDSGAGCIHVADERAVKKLQKISYRPVIVQDYIRGTDIGSSIFCRNGEIEAFLAHQYARSVYTAYVDPAVYESIARIVWRLRLSGIFNFDMRLTPDGEVFFLECNPRVYYKIAMSMLAGVNFLDLGFPWRPQAEAPSLTSPVAVPFPKAMLGALFTPWKLDPAAWRVLKFLLEDPIPYAREKLGIERGR